MSKRALRKDLFREIYNNKSRFLSLFMIVALGVAFFAGVRATKPDMRITADKKLDADSLMDIRVVSDKGLTKDDIDRISKVEKIDYVVGSHSSDIVFKSDNKQLVLKFMSYTNDINKITIIDGRLAKSDDECVVDAKLLEKTDFEIGDYIDLSDNQYGSLFTQEKFKIVGVCTSPLYMSLERGTSTLGSGSVSAYIMINDSAFTMPVYTEAYALVADAKDYTCLYQSYDDYIDETVDRIEDIAPNGWYVLDRNSIQTYVEYGMDADRIGKIGNVFPVIFFMVAALVCLTSMTRMVEEKREQIGVLKALGYNNFDVAMKFLSFALAATIAGAVFGGIIGCYVFPYVIINAYAILYTNAGAVQTPINIYYCVFSGATAVVCIVFATLVACLKETIAAPAILLRPKAPKNGKRILLERVTFFWKSLNFSMKSTVRNLVRYKKRLFMTIFGIGCCTALMIVGFGLYDSTSDIVRIQYEQIKKYNFEFEIEPEADKKTVDECIAAIRDNKKIMNVVTACSEAVTIEANDVKKDSYIDVISDTAIINEFITLRDRKSGKKLTLNDDTVILTEKASSLLDVKVGDTIEIKPNDTTSVKVVVGDICENYISHFVYFTPKLYKKVFDKEPLYNTVYANINYDELTRDSNENEEKLVDELAAQILDMKAIGQVSIENYMMDKFSDMIGSLNVVVAVLTISAGLLAFVVIYNLNNINISERRKELATLKVLGFYDVEVSSYVFRENIFLTLIGIIFGLFLGRILHKFVILTAELDMIMFGRIIKNSSYIYSVLLTVVFATIVNIFMHFSLKKIDMAASMKSVD